MWLDSNYLLLVIFLAKQIKYVVIEAVDYVMDSVSFLIAKC